MLILYVSDSILSLFIQVFTMVFVLVTAHRFGKGAFAFGAFAMLLANIVGQIVVAGGGPGACVGMVALPAYGMLMAWVSLSVSEWWKGIRRKSKAGTENESLAQLR